MTKKETLKWVVQIIASIASAILTALGTTSCMGLHKQKSRSRTGRDSYYIPFEPELIIGFH